MTGAVKLASPIEFGDDVISELTLREPTLGDLKKMDREAGQIGKMVALIASISGHPPSAIERIKASDLEAVTDALEKSMPASLITGET